MNTENLVAGPALDRLVAERVMGWRVHNRNAGLWSRSGDPNEPLASAVAVSDWLPSRNIAQAFELVPKIPGFFLYCRADGTWTAYANPKSKGGPRGHGSTAPLAICRLALVLHP